MVNIRSCKRVDGGKSAARHLHVGMTRFKFTLHRLKMNYCCSCLVYCSSKCINKIQMVVDFSVIIRIIIIAKIVLKG